MTLRPAMQIRYEHYRASMPTSGTVSGTMSDCLLARCIHQAVARLLVTAAMNDYRRQDCASRDGIVLKAIEPSA
jgi:hypothetical protein